MSAVWQSWSFKMARELRVAHPGAEGAAMPETVFALKPSNLRL